MNLTSQLVCTCLTFILSGYTLSAQSTISGKVMETEEVPVVFANVALYDTATSELVKVETTDLDGLFSFKEVPNAIYNLEITFIGLSTINQVVNASNQSNIELGELYMTTEGIELVETVVTAQRVMVEVKPDRTVFNVDGTVNSAGSDAIELFAQSPRRYRGQ